MANFKVKLVELSHHFSWHS